MAADGRQVLHGSLYLLLNITVRLRLTLVAILQVTRFDRLEFIHSANIKLQKFIAVSLTASSFFSVNRLLLTFHPEVITATLTMTSRDAI
jgi:hypothetical protein